MTIGAVSRQIKSLEDELGLKLFVREKNGVHLTSDAQDLFSEVAASFARCSEAIQALKREKAEAFVTFACSDAFATLWLMPRMADFWSKHPHITINHLISDQVRDFRNSEVDLFVRPATGAWPNEYTEPLFNDLVYPVCGSDFAQQHRLSSSVEIVQLPLLHMDWTNSDWPRWQDFLQAASIPFQGLRGQRVGAYSVLLTAAEANRGLALGWHSLVKPLIDQGRLVRFSELAMRDPVGFCLGWNGRKTLSSPAQTFRAWMRKQVNMSC